VAKKSLRTLAQGQPCMVRIPGVCNGNPETTVLAHIRRGNVAGMGQKPPDLCGVWACSSCHDVMDMRKIDGPHDALAMDHIILRALVQQLAYYHKHEIVRVIL
jgi:hypothetical protein